ncbi:unnamed protein product [Polarella glacialis]|uniref:Pentatricopeptide repeat-containing protein, chloroplastic n=1 Tax=Polarella glacialis TaxID=89957 RepID=A0A813EBV6_POLGL|nr:unnamed protein product [Polarella glacialis]
MPQMKCNPNVVSYSSAISACEKGGQWQLAMELLAEMPEKRISPNEVSYNAAISACEKGREWQLALGLLAQMSEVKVAPNRISFHAAISACGKASYWQMAVGLLCRMPQLMVLPNEISYNAAITACGKGSQWHIALELLNEMPARALTPDDVSFNAAISACEKAREWQRALGLLALMPQLRVAPNKISYGASISACEKVARWDLALQLLNQMPQAAVIPDVVGYSAAISACEKAGKWQLAAGLLHQMSENQVAPNRISYNAAISSCGTAGAWQPALALLDSMLLRSLLPDGQNAGSVAGALQVVASRDAAFEFLGKMLDLWTQRYNNNNDNKNNNNNNLQETATSATASQSYDESGYLEELPSAMQVLMTCPGVVAILKPAGVTTESAVRQLSQQLAREQSMSRPVDLQIVSRLDHPTSGVVPVATGVDGSPAANWLQAQFAGRLVEKEYLCLCEGPPLGAVGSKGDISTPLLTVEQDNGRVCRTETSPLGREAFTSYEVLARYLQPEPADPSQEPATSELMLLLVRPKTGRTHQIRVHLASIGRPLVGDLTYGAKWASLLPACTRLMNYLKFLSTCNLWLKLLSLGASPAQEEVSLVLAPEVERWRSNPTFATGVLSGLARNRLPEVARQVLSFMGQSRVEVNSFHCSAAISACEKAGKWQHALDLLSQMPQMRVSPTVMCYSAAISACEKGRKWQLALCTLGHMEESGIPPDSIIFNAVISACEKGGEWQLALGLLQNIFEMRLLPTVISYSAAISACEKGGQWQLALDLLAVMPQMRCEPNVVSYSSAISACEKGGQWQLAMELLAEMPERRISPNEVSYNAAISACEKGREWQLALGLLTQMPENKVTPSRISFNAAISSCTEYWQMAIDILGRMPQMMIQPNEISCSAAITACGKGSALGLLNEMPARGLTPNVVSYNAECVREGPRVAEGSRPPDLDARELGVPPDAVSQAGVLPDLIGYSAAISACDTAGEWQPALSVLEVANKLRETLGSTAAWQLLDKPTGTEEPDNESSYLEEVPSAMQVLMTRPGVVAILKPAGVTTESAVRLASEQRWPRPVDLQIVSRLDHPTSGVVGSKGDISTPLLTVVELDNGRQSEVSPLGREAFTSYEVMERFFPLPFEPFRHGDSELMLLLVRPRTGRMHQIRVHLASIGRPVVGDLTYGSKLASLLPACFRLFLHCKRTALRDLNGEPFFAEAPLSDELSDILSYLRPVAEPSQ